MNSALFLRDSCEQVDREGISVRDVRNPDCQAFVLDQ